MSCSSACSSNPSTSRLSYAGEHAMGHSCPCRQSSDAPRNTVAVIMRIAYGYNIQRDNDPFVERIEESIRLAGVGSQAGRWAVDSLPWLRFFPSWFPGMKFKTKAKEWSKQMDEMTRAPYWWTREQLNAGTARPSFVSEHLTDADEDSVIMCAAGLYAGAADTVAGTLISYFKYMIEFPEVQRKAKEEIDRVVGKDRLPDMGDRDSLPYVRNLTKELLRLAPPAPLGGCVLSRSLHPDPLDRHPASPHARRRVQGLHPSRRLHRLCQYLVRNLSCAIFLVYIVCRALMHDEEVYPEPFDLNPDRHTVPDVPNPESWVFGYGHRICPGACMWGSRDSAQRSSRCAQACILPKRPCSSV